MASEGPSSIVIGAVDDAQAAHAQQKLCAMRIFKAMYVDERPRIAIHLAADFQAGKTGVIQYLATLCHVNSVNSIRDGAAASTAAKPSLHVHGEYEHDGIELSSNIFICTGMNDDAWVRQTKARMPRGLKDSVYSNPARLNLQKLIGDRLRRIDGPQADPKVRGRGSSAAAPYTPLLLIVDESRVASGDENFIGKLIKHILEIIGPDRNVWRTRGVRLLVVDATHPAAILTLACADHRMTGTCAMPTSSAYVGVDRLVQAKRVYQAYNLTKRDQVQACFEQAQSFKLLELDDPLNHVIRLPHRNQGAVVKNVMEVFKAGLNGKVDFVLFNSKDQPADGVAWRSKRTAKDRLVTEYGLWQYERFGGITNADLPWRGFGHVHPKVAGAGGAGGTGSSSSSDQHLPAGLTASERAYEDQLKNDPLNTLDRRHARLNGVEDEYGVIIPHAQLVLTTGAAAIRERMFDINLGLFNWKPRNHTIVFIQDMFRAGKTITKKHVGFMHDRGSPMDDTNGQSFLGRACGYDVRPDGQYAFRGVVFNSLDGTERLLRAWAAVLCLDDLDLPEGLKHGGGAAKPDARDDDNEYDDDYDDEGVAAQAVIKDEHSDLENNAATAAILRLLLQGSAGAGAGAGSSAGAGAGAQPASPAGAAGAAGAVPDNAYVLELRNVLDQVRDAHPDMTLEQLSLLLETDGRMAGITTRAGLISGLLTIRMDPGNGAGALRMLRAKANGPVIAVTAEMIYDSPGYDTPDIAAAKCREYLKQNGGFFRSQAPRWTATNGKKLHNGGLLVTRLEELYYRVNPNLPDNWARKLGGLEAKHRNDRAAWVAEEKAIGLSTEMIVTRADLEACSNPAQAQATARLKKTDGMTAAGRAFGVEAQSWMIYPVYESRQGDNLVPKWHFRCPAVEQWPPYEQAYKAYEARAELRKSVTKLRSHFKIPGYEPGVLPDGRFKGDLTAAAAAIAKYKAEKQLGRVSTGPRVRRHAEDNGDESGDETAQRLFVAPARRRSSTQRQAAVAGNARRQAVDAAVGIEDPSSSSDDDGADGNYDGAGAHGRGAQRRSVGGRGRAQRPSVGGRARAGTGASRSPVRANGAEIAADTATEGAGGHGAAAGGGAGTPAVAPAAGAAGSPSETQRGERSDRKQPRNYAVYKWEYPDYEITARQDRKHLPHDADARILHLSTDVTYHGPYVHGRPEGQFTATFPDNTTWTGVYDMPENQGARVAGPGKYIFPNKCTLVATAVSNGWAEVIGTNAAGQFKFEFRYPCGCVWEGVAPQGSALHVLELTDYITAYVAETGTFTDKAGNTREAPFPGIDNWQHKDHDE